MDKLTIEAILNIVSDYCNITREEIMSTKNRKGSKYACYCRHLVMYLARVFTRHSLDEIGYFFDKDHTTIIHGSRNIANWMKTYEEVERDVTNLNNIIQNNYTITKEEDKFNELLVEYRRIKAKIHSYESQLAKLSEENRILKAAINPKQVKYLLV